MSTTEKIMIVAAIAIVAMVIQRKYGIVEHIPIVGSL